MVAGWIANRLAIRSTAKKVIATAKAAWGTPHEYRQVNYLEFTQCDLGWYDDRQRELEALGFLPVADFEDVTISRSLRDSQPTFMRVMRSPSGDVCACIFQVTSSVVTPESAGAPQIRETFCVEFESEFSDGTFFLTTPTRDVDLTDEVPGIRRVRPAFEEMVEERLRRHREELAMYQENHPSVQPVLVLGWEDLVAQMHRCQGLKIKHRAATGWISEEELNRFGAGQSPELLKAVWAEIRRQNKS